MGIRRISRTLQRSTRLVVSLVLAAALGDAPALAQTYSITGNVRYQVGNGLPIPMTLAPVPIGRAQAVPGATVQQSFIAGLPPKITMPASQLTAPAVAMTLPVFPINPAQLQLQTAISAKFPRVSAVFQAGGRTGAATTTRNVLGVGLVRYQALLNQFGGPGLPSFGGNASIALPALGTPPCGPGPGCVAIFAPYMPGSAFGGPLTWTSAVTQIAPSPGLFAATIGPLGTILGLGLPLGPGIANLQTSFAGPWTTGMVTVSVPSAVPPQFFQLTGSDNRTPAGLGTISLVSGGLTQRSIDGPNATRAWLNLTIVPEPATTLQVACGFAGLQALRRLRRRRDRVRPH